MNSAIGPGQGRARSVCRAQTVILVIDDLQLSSRLLPQSSRSPAAAALRIGVSRVYNHAHPNGKPNPIQHKQ